MGGSTDGSCKTKTLKLEGFKVDYVTNEKHKKTESSTNGKMSVEFFF